MEETFYDQRATAQEQLEEGYIDFDEYTAWIQEIEAKQSEYFEEEW